MISSRLYLLHSLQIKDQLSTHYLLSVAQTQYPMLVQAQTVDMALLWQNVGVGVTADDLSDHEIEAAQFRWWDVLLVAL